MIPTLLTDSISFDIDRAIHYTLLWGLEAVELRAIGGPRDRVPFVNEQKLKRRLTESDLPVLAIVPGMFEGELEDRAEWLNELATLDETLQFCRRLDCKQVVVSSFLHSANGSTPSGGPHPVDESDRGAARSGLPVIADIMRRAAERASRSNVYLCIANDHRGRMRTGSELARLLRSIDHPAVLAAWHPDEAYMAGENPADGLDALADRIGIVRCRSVARVGNGWEVRTIDRGAVDWADQIKRLKDLGFSGPLSLDVRVEPKAKNGLREATELIRMIRAR